MEDNVGLERVPWILNQERRQKSTEALQLPHGKHKCRLRSHPTLSAVHQRQSLDEVLVGHMRESIRCGRIEAPPHKHQPCEVAWEGLDTQWGRQC